MQATLEDKTTLSLGFDPVANETAQTVLDLALQKLNDYALLLDPADADQQIKNILKNLVGVMTDRAANMKAFDRQLEGYVQNNVDPNIQLEFLHCNAHFLLGLSTAADKALKEVAETQGQLGREVLPQFKRFKSPESAVCRYVRMACDTLGPRGDEKSGCHHLWLAFCAMHEKKSVITSFRANRFNNLFCAAAALIHHKDLITAFFQHRPPSNLKQGSVQADALCDKLSVMVLGLALMYVYITGPFWFMINSDIHYLDQYQFIQPLYVFVQQVEQQPEILLGDVDAISHNIESHRLRPPQSPAAESVLGFRDTAKAIDVHLLLHVIKGLARHFRETFDRQLVDFLPDGKYGSAPDDQARKRMEHCQLTNLLGEACFADLDYSKFKNRRATLHHHTTLNMGKRNHPISGWLLTKPAEEQTALLAKARQIAPRIREVDNHKHLIVLEELNDAMVEQERARAAREVKQQQTKQTLMADVETLGGACKTKEDVDNLLASCTTKTEKTNALKVQCRFYREFFNAKLPLTNLQPDQLASNLTQFLQTLSPAVAAEPLPSTANEDEDADEEESFEFEDLPAAPSSTQSLFNFQFAGQGQTVAVFFDEGFYIGQVLHSHRTDLADVTFMEQRGNKNIFKWPASDAIEEVRALFVFYAGFDMKEKNRVWVVEDSDWNMLRKRWRLYLQEAGLQ